VAEAIGERVRRYILDGNDEDLRRLLGVAEATREMARSAFGRVGMREGWHVIECGCGPIGGLAVMAEMVGPAGRVVGVDVNELAIQRARSVMAALRLDNVEFLRHGNVRSPRGSRPGSRSTTWSVIFGPRNTSATSGSQRRSSLT